MAMEQPELLLAFSISSEEDLEYEAASEGSFPTGIAITAAGDYVVADHEQVSVKVFNSEGDFRCHLGRGAFSSVWDVATTKSGKVLVSDPQASGFKVFSRRDKFLAITDLATHIKEPYGLAYDGPTGSAVLTDKASRCAFLHDACGVVQQVLKDTASEYGHGPPAVPRMQFPSYACFDHAGGILVSDVGSHCLYSYSRDGCLRWTYGIPGCDDGQLQHPCGVCLAPDGRILLADSANCRVHTLTPGGQFLDYALTWEDGIAEPQALAVNGQGHLVVTEGATGVVKVFDCKT